MIASPEPTSEAFSLESEPKPAFTPMIAGSDNARRISQLGIKARQVKQEQARLAKESPCASPDERYKQQRLTRVRAQLNTLQDRFDDALAGRMFTLEKTGKPVQVFDPQHIDRIAASIGRVAELERQLSDWALPGSKRPALERKSRGSGATVSAEDVD